MTPPVGALVDNVTVPVEVAPPATEVGDKVSELSVIAPIVKVAETGLDAALADMLAGVELATVVVVILNVAVVAPAFTTTDVGTVAALKLLLSVTLIPPEGATPLRVTVPIEVPPPITEAGFRESAVGQGGLTVKATPVEVDPNAAVIVGITFDPVD